MAWWNTPCTARPDGNVFHKITAEVKALNSRPQSTLLNAPIQCHARLKLRHSEARDNPGGEMGNLINELTLYKTHLRRKGVKRARRRQTNSQNSWPSKSSFPFSGPAYDRFFLGSGICGPFHKRKTREKSLITGPTSHPTQALEKRKDRCPNISLSCSRFTQRNFANTHSYVNNP